MGIERTSRQELSQGIVTGVYFSFSLLQIWPELGAVQCSVLSSSLVAADFGRAC